jgi:hypothetical protein
VTLTRAHACNSKINNFPRVVAKGGAAIPFIICFCSPRFERNKEEETDSQRDGRLAVIRTDSSQQCPPLSYNEEKSPNQAQHQK